jgi:hypothetical protein
MLANRYWFGIHVLINSNEDTLELARDLPSLAELGVNVLLVEVNYHYEFISHPELRMPNSINQETVKQLLKICRQNNVRLLPQVQCLGHQSWAENTFPLLVRYPDMDETPGQYLNNAGIYCRSWCPSHPQVNQIVFNLMDELLEVFEADGLHVGMDEVFLIGSEHCPNCRGKDPAHLFAQAVNDYHAHLVGKHKVEMLMWGDRLLDDAVTGYGEWEAAQNGTHPALEMIPKDIILCDWHYTRLETYPSIPLFLEKGFRVLPGGWREVEATKALLDFSNTFTQPEMLGHLCTTWGTVRPGEISKWLPVQVAAEFLAEKNK